MNTDAHGSWMIKVEISDLSDLEQLLSAEDYEKYAAEEAGH